MKILKKLVFVFSMLFIFILSACNQMNTVEKRLEDQGYYIIETDKEYCSQNIEAYYLIYDSNDIIAGQIYEFESIEDLNEFVNSINETNILIRDNQIFENILIYAPEEILNAIQK